MGREIRVPERVTTPPTVRDCPSMRNADAEFSVYVWPANVMAFGTVVLAGMGMLELSSKMYVPEGGKEIGVPETVVTSPEVRVSPSSSPSVLTA